MLNPKILNPDYYGERVATCSSDKKISVFTHHSVTDVWAPDANWKAHDGPVLSVRRVLASLRVVELGTSSIWPSHRVVFPRSNSQNLARTESEWFKSLFHYTAFSDVLGTGWIEKDRLLDSKAAIFQVAFAPIHLGLRLVLPHFPL